MAQRLKASPDVVLQRAGHAKRLLEPDGQAPSHPTISNDVEVFDMGMLGIKGKWETLETMSSEVVGSADGGFWGFSGPRVGGSEESLLGHSACFSRTEIPSTGFLQNLELLSDKNLTLQSGTNSISTGSMGKGRGVKDSSLDSNCSLDFSTFF